MSKWRVTGVGGWSEETGEAVYQVTKGSHQLCRHDHDELEALLNGAKDWISVEDRLPEIGVDVLVYRPEAGKSHDPLIKVSRRGWESCVNQSPQGVLHCFECWCHPSHWMPIAPPSTN